MAFVVPQMSLFLGIIPALLILWLGLRGYEGMYKDKNIFLFFIVGIILGFIIAIIELFTAGVGVIYIILFPILEQMGKVIILNLGRFHEKRETVIYGLALGLGFGSIFLPASLLGNQSTDLVSFIFIMIGSIGIIFFQAAAGILIGMGVYQNKLAKYTTLAVLLELPITAGFFISTYLQIPYLQSLVIVYGIIVFWYALYQVMPHVRQDAERRKRVDKEEPKPQPKT
jgi:hypothetical protein